MLFTRDDGGAIRYAGRDLLGYGEVEEFLNLAFRKKLRKAGRVEKLLDTLRRTNEAEFTWNYVPRIRRRDDHWATVHAWKSEEGDRLYLLGPQSEEVLEKVNRAYYRKLPNSIKQKIRLDKRKTRKARLEKKRRRRDERLQKWAVRHMPKVKRRKTFIATPISLERNERLTPQFRKNRIFWREVLDAAVQIFEVRRDAKHSARELVAREMYASLERNGYRFAQYKRRGFTLRVDLVDGIWRGDITPLTISCTKDNTHPTYRRMRDYFAGLLTGHDDHERRERRAHFTTAFLMKVA